jgi:mRNA interferase HigB
MHVISRKPFEDAMKKYPNDANAIATVYRILKLGSFTNPEQLRAVFKSLDNFKYRDKWWVIDIGSNNLRLLAFIEFKHQRLYVKHIITHAEYEELCRKYRN